MPPRDPARSRWFGALGVLLFLGAGLTLRALGLAGPAAWAAATVVLMATWWITEPVPLWATALLPLALFPLLAGVGVRELLVQYFDPVNFLFLGGMWIAAAMEQWGLHRRMALGVVARVGASPRRIVLGFMVATGFVSLWVSNTAAALMMCPIGIAVLQKFEEQPGRDEALVRRFGVALMLGIAYAASMAGIGSKIGTGTNFVFVKQSARVLSEEISFLTWFKIGLPIVLVALPLAWLYLVRVSMRLPSEPIAGGREAIDEARRRLGRMSRGERAALAAFLSAAVLWTFRQRMEFGSFTLPGWTDLIPWTWADVIGRPVSTLPAPLSELLGPRGTESMVAVIIGVSLMLIPVERGPLRMALPLRRAGGISWGLLVLLGGGFAMAHGIQKSGLSELVARSLSGVTPAQPYLALVVVCLLTVTLSEVASNTATASILLPLLAALAPNLGLHPATLMLAATLTASFGFMLPAGTPPNAVVFASGYVTVTRMARSGFLVDVAGAILIATSCYFLVPLALGLR